MDKLNQRLDELEAKRYDLQDELKYTNIELEFLLKNKKDFEQLSNKPHSRYLYTITCTPSSELYHNIVSIGWFTTIEKLEEKYKEILDSGFGMVYEIDIDAGEYAEFYTYKTGTELKWNLSAGIEMWDRYDGGFPIDELMVDDLPDDFFWNCNQETFLDDYEEWAL